MTDQAYAAAIDERLAAIAAASRPFADPIRPPDTDEEPWLPSVRDVPEPRGISVFGLEDLAGWWAIATATVAAALAAVLVLLALRRIR